jgi:hypothetical protein
MQPRGKHRSHRRSLAACAILVTSGTAMGAERKLGPPNAWDAAAVERARVGAVRRLGEPECQKLLWDFRDGRGRPLAESLKEWDMSASEYVGTLPFLDGSRQPLCRRPRVKLVAVPGAGRVWVCGSFAEYQLRQPRAAETVLIHEALHTLGLGEDPPTSMEITQRVESRCR